MGNKYRAEQYISISASESGTEIELKMLVDFTVHPGSKATMIDPPEMPLAEVIKVRFFDGHDELQFPWSIEYRFTSSPEFNEWILSEASEQYLSAEDENADQRREMMREDRL